MSGVPSALRRLRLAIVDKIEDVLAKLYAWEMADPPPHYERVDDDRAR
ncbi:MAG: hypothetical protein J0J01_01145 [Reyranella sp.]|nr:hypothetical protein [Reyranella sp.]MBN9085485.1 hypothetical protein [Reyranella sp.]